MTQPLVLNWEQISSLLDEIEIHQPMKQAFIEYSNGNAEIPPVGELLFDQPPGEVHIKYGYIRGGSFYVIKIASGFGENNQLGLKPGQGMMLLFDIATGIPKAVLIDQANLTDLRTGIAGAMASNLLVNQDINSAAIIGTGVQARYQARCLMDLMPIKTINVWGRDSDKSTALQKDLSDLEVDLVIHKDLAALVSEARLIITTTSSKKAIIQSDWVQPGTHITAVGSDTPEKCELDVNILARADIVVADSITQNELRGEVHQALKSGLIEVSSLIEIGQIFEGSAQGRSHYDQITVADLTGVAVQDLVIAEAVYKAAIS
ncbi:MAG: ornithine cyclodeaminase family protein [Gammaproteobacteria bacterium]|nr:ornithine cyclodeaminase family protein [Gammaproteobacteria bacterium]